MATIRRIPKRLRGASYRGRLMIDAFRGVMRVRKWPKKRGPPTSPLQAFWVDWFVQANRLAKYADGASMARAIQMTKGSGMYPRDVLLKAMRGRLYNWVDQDGWRWYSMAAIGDISESLDVLAQTIGSVLVRAVDRWRAPAAGNINDVLTYKGNLAPPVWQTPGGGVSQGPIPGTPITADNTVSEYVLDVTGLAVVEVQLVALVFNAADRPNFRFSVDGGATFKSGAADYTEMMVAKATDNAKSRDMLLCSDQNSAAAFYLAASFANIGAGRCSYQVTVGVLSVFAVVRNGFANFDGPVTHIKVYSLLGNNLKTGTVRAIGF